MRGTWEPHGGSGKQVHGLQYIKLLVRKVVTIYHALDVVVRRQPRTHICDSGGSGRAGSDPGGGGGTVDGGNGGDDSDSGGGVLIWADEDVTFVRAPDARLLRFAQGVDVGYVPFQVRRHAARERCSGGVVMLC